MTWQWFNVVPGALMVEAVFGCAVVGGPVRLFGARWWCVWTQSRRQVWRPQALRALDSGQAIVEVAKSFPASGLDTKRAFSAREIGRA